MKVQVHVQVSGFIVEEIIVQREQMPAIGEILVLPVWDRARVIKVIPTKNDYPIVFVVPESLR